MLGGRQAGLGNRTAQPGLDQRLELRAELLDELTRQRVDVERRRGCGGGLDQRARLGLLRLGQVDDLGQRRQVRRVRVGV